MNNDPASNAGEQASRAEIQRLWVDLQEQRKIYRHDVAKLVDEIERLQETLKTIERWAEAYPLTVFPKPDYEQARKLLEAGGMTLDALSADAMRHVVEEVAKIARAALARSLQLA